jgi:6-phosphofructokinase 1
MVAWYDDRAISLSLEEVLSQSPRLVDPNGYLVQTARSLGIYVGENCQENQKIHLEKTIVGAR